MERVSVPRFVWTDPESAPKECELPLLRIESVLFLAGVTLSAAIIQSRYSEGTLASKYDRLWEAGTQAEEGVAPQLRPLKLLEMVQTLAADTETNKVQQLLKIRRQFMQALSQIAPTFNIIHEMTASPLPYEYRSRFDFIDDLRERCGSGLHAVIAYGSSITSRSFSDYDLLLVAENAEGLLCKLAGQSPTWRSKEMNVGVYSPQELIQMQSLSGDNLGEYGLCLWGSTPVVEKPVNRLLIRNFSFGVLRQRQQLGMLSRAVCEQYAAGSNDGDDRRNLYEYFVKIPANVAKGIWGALGERRSKEQIQEWLLTELGFDTAHEQLQATVGDPALALAKSALATGKVLALLNERVQLVKVSDQDNS